MAKLSALTDFFYNELHPDLQRLEEDRKKLARKLINVAIAIAFISVFITYAIFNNSSSHSEADFAPLFIGGALFMWTKKLMSKDYTHEFKDTIIHPLIHQIDSSLQYHKTLHIPQGHFERSQLFRNRIDRYSGNDLVQGELSGVNLRFSDVHAEYVTRDSKGRSTWHTIFQGLFIIADFNKDFQGRTSVLPDKAEKLFGTVIGSWLQRNNMSQEMLVKMDDPLFEKHFVVYGTNQVEARYILTHAMMKRLLDFKTRSKVPLYISFVNEQIYLALEYNKDLFEPTIFSSLLEYSLVIEYVSTLQLAIGIIEELKLNERLWSKE
jgi:hypothetical protein